MALKFGSKSGTGYTRNPFPTHSGVKPGPLNLGSPVKDTNPHTGLQPPHTEEAHTSKTKEKKYDTNIKDFPLGSQERADEYDKRNWKQDETTTGHPDFQPRVKDPGHLESVGGLEPDMPDTPKISGEGKPRTSEPKKEGFWKRLGKGLKSDEFKQSMYNLASSVAIDPTRKKLYSDKADKFMTKKPTEKESLDMAYRKNRNKLQELKIQDYKDSQNKTTELYSVSPPGVDAETGGADLDLNTNIGTQKTQAQLSEERLQEAQQRQQEQSAEQEQYNKNVFSTTGSQLDEWYAAHPNYKGKKIKREDLGLNPKI